MRALGMLVLILGLALGVFLLIEGRAQAPTPEEDEATPVKRHAAGQGGSYLSEARRQFLFDIERADLRLGQALKPVAAALRTGQPAALARALAEDVAATTPAAIADGTWVNQGAFRWRALDPQPGRTKAQFLAWAESLQDDFETISAVSFGRKENDAAILGKPGEVATSHGVFRIAGSTAGQGRLELTGHFTLVHAPFADAKATPERAGWIQGISLHDVTAVASAAPLFEEITDATGLDVAGLHDTWKHGDLGKRVHPGGVYLGDVNNDELIDVLVSELDKPTALYHGSGAGSFERVAWTPPVPGGLTHVLLFDADGDGDDEVLNAGILYDWDAEAGTLNPVRGATRVPNASGIVADYDRDGTLDLYLLDAGPPPGRPGARAFFDDERITGRANMLLRGLGDGRFTDVTKAAGASGGHGRTFAAVWFHANDDDRPDLFCANEFGRNAFLVSRADGTFEDRPEIDPKFGGFSMGVAAGDLDGDQRVDLYVSNMYSKAGHRIYHHLDLETYPEGVRRMFAASVAGNRFYRARGDLQFHEDGTAAGVNAVGWGWSGAVADFDLDGHLDIYAPCGHTSVDRDTPDG